MYPTLTRVHTLLMFTVGKIVEDYRNKDKFRVTKDMPGEAEAN